MNRAQLLFAALSLLAACATRRVLVLDEFQPRAAAAPASALAGKSVFVEVSAGSDLMNTDVRKGASLTEPPSGYAFSEMNEADVERWDDLVTTARKAGSKEVWSSVGWMRNGYGMHLADIFSVDPPAVFLEETLKRELQAQGATLASSAGEADLVVKGELRYFKVDIYMKYWADVVVDWEYSPRGGQPVRQTRHTHGETTAWTSSAWEFYQPLRQCEQEMMWLVLEDLEGVAR